MLFFFLLFFQNLENRMYHGFQYNVFNIGNNQHIRMISEGSCDTEDWSNDAENSTLHHRNKLHFTIYLFGK